MEMHRATGNWKLGLSLSLVTVILWGLVPVAIAIVLKKIDPYTINWFRFLTAFILLSMHLLWQHNLPQLSKLTSIPIYLWAMAILGLLGNYIFFVFGLKATSPSHAEVLIQLAGVFLSLGGLVIFRERYTRLQWLGVGVLLTGFMGFFAEQFKAIASQLERTGLIEGSMMLVVAALTWAAYALVQKQLLTKLASAHIMWVIYGACGLLFWPLARPQTLGQLDPIGWSALIFCGLNTVVAYGAFAESLQHWEASRVSAILALAPIFTIGSMATIEAIAPNIVAAERITQLGLFGAILVVVGSMSIALGRHHDRVD
jgi:drug/metabolite transporter (DMT)-like permease